MSKVVEVYVALTERLPSRAWRVSAFAIQAWYMKRVYLQIRQFGRCRLDSVQIETQELR